MIGMWRNQRFLAGEWHEDVLELLKKFGRVVRIAPNECRSSTKRSFKDSMAEKAEVAEQVGTAVGLRILPRQVCLLRKMRSCTHFYAREFRKHIR